MPDLYGEAGLSERRSSDMTGAPLISAGVVGGGNSIKRPLVDVVREQWCKSGPKSGHQRELMTKEAGVDPYSVTECEKVRCPRALTCTFDPEKHARIVAGEAE